MPCPFSIGQGVCNMPLQVASPYKKGAVKAPFCQTRKAVKAPLPDLPPRGGKGIYGGLTLRSFVFLDDLLLDVAGNLLVAAEL